MADFKQAVEWMKEGKKVKRIDYWYAVMEGEYQKGILLKWSDGDIDCGIQELYFCDFEANDWEIYEDNKITKIIEKWLKDYKTSWKYLERKGYRDAEADGDCVFINAYDCNAIEKLKDALGDKSE